MNTHQTPIAIVGVAAMMPGSTTVDGFWRDVVTGRDLVTDVPDTHWRLADYYDPDPAAPDRTYGRRGAFLSTVDFPPLDFGVPPNTMPATDTTQLLALMVAERVLADATGPELSTLDRERTSVILGTGALELLYSMSNRLQRPVWRRSLLAHGIGEAAADAICDTIAGHYVPWQEATFPGLLSNVVAGRVANRFDLHGTNHTTDAACASSLAAISSSVNELVLGKADLAIAGGVDTLNDIVMYMCFSKTPALSASGDCRPFAAAADGTVLGEGLVMLALKRLADAERDGDRVYAVLRGIGSSSDGRAKAIYAPVAGGQARALRRAYEQAGYGPDTVELVEAHGTGTVAGDAAEYAALRSVFAASGRADDHWCALGSLKSQFGHTKSAAGAAGLLKAALALHHKVLPPTIKVDAPSAELGAGDGPLYLNTVARPWVRDGAHPRRASVSSFGFGGSNFHVTLEEYVPGGDGAARPARRLRTAPSELVLVSAGTEDELLAAAKELLAGEEDLPAVARRSQRAFRAGEAHRLAVVATGLDDLAAKLDRAATLVSAGAPSAPGIHHASGPADPGQVGFLFPGQGSQYVGMGAGVAMEVPAAQAVWDHVAGLSVGDRPLHQVVFPPPAFTAAGRAAAEDALTATEWAQPALAAHSLALLAVLGRLGVRPDHVAGHSFGELVALHAAGAFDGDTLVRLARRRGELMRDAAAVPGAMLAVRAGQAEVARVIADSGMERVWVANHNGPHQTVVSGDADAVAGLADMLSAHGVATTGLNAATAFHSPLVAAAGAPLREFLAGVEVRAPAIPVHGNADAAVYPAARDQVRGRIAEHLSAPVRFAEAVEAMYAAGARTFVEVGAGSALTGLVGDILGARPHMAVSLDKKGRDGMTAAHEAFGRLAVAGVEMDFESLWADYDPPVPAPATGSGLTVPILGANYGKPEPPEVSPAEPGAAPTVVADDGGQAPILEIQRQAAEAHREYQEQAARAHEEYQRLLAESHQAFLTLTENSLPGNGQRAVVPAPRPPDPALLPAPRPPEPVVSTVEPEPVGDLESLLLSVVAEKTGYPAGMLATTMELEADLGIDSIKRVEILSALRDQVPDLPTIDTATLGALRTLEQIAGVLRAPAAPSTDDQVLTRLAVRVAPAVAPGLATAGLHDGPVFVTDDSTGVAAHVADLLGAHGVPATVVTEIPAQARRVVYLAGSGDPLDSHRAALSAARTVAGTVAGSGGLFVTVQDTGGDFGRSGGERAWHGGVSALARTAAREWPEVSVRAIDCARTGRAPEDVARAIVTELLTGGDTQDVGLGADGTRIVVTAVPAPVEPGSARQQLGPASVVVATGGARGVTAAALVELAKQCRPRLVLLGRTDPDAPTEAGQQVRDTLAALREAGSPVRYHAVDVRDTAAVAAVLAEVRADWGPVTGIVHGAGVLADRSIVDKTDADLDRVFGTKVLGLRALLEVTREDPLDLLCLFSSVAARFGNPGQSDYAMANEVLNQVAFAEQAARPGCRVRSIGWGPWRGGMVDARLERHFQALGVPLIPLAAGARAFVDEVTGGADDVEVLVTASGAGEPSARPGAVGQVHLSARTHPYLADHAVADVPVLPLVLALEWFTGAAGGAALRDVAVLRKVQLDRLAGPGHLLTVHRDGDRLSLGTGPAHYQATVDSLAAARDWPPPADLRPVDPDIYDGTTLFHGPAFRALRTVAGVSDAGAAATLAGARELGWPGHTWTDPAATDGALQLAVLWARRRLGAATLPMSVGRYRVHRTGTAARRREDAGLRPANAERSSAMTQLTAVVLAGPVTPGSARCDVAVLDPSGRPVVELLDVNLVARPDRDG